MLNWRTFFFWHMSRSRPWTLFLIANHVWAFFDKEVQKRAFWLKNWSLYVNLCTFFIFLYGLSLCAHVNHYMRSLPRSDSSLSADFFCLWWPYSVHHAKIIKNNICTCSNIIFMMGHFNKLYKNFSGVSLKRNMDRGYSRKIYKIRWAGLSQPNFFDDSRHGC